MTGALCDDDRSANVTEVVISDKPDHPVIRQSVRWRESYNGVMSNSIAINVRVRISLQYNLTLGTLVWRNVNKHGISIQRPVALMTA